MTLIPLPIFFFLLSHKNKKRGVPWYAPHLWVNAYFSGRQSVLFVDLAVKVPFPKQKADVLKSQKGYTSPCGEPFIISKHQLRMPFI